MADRPSCAGVEAGGDTGRATTGSVPQPASRRYETDNHTLHQRTDRR
ncbi:hypothetical protein SSBG_03233 [Streptomyces sp. SPB074]|nr:hypothetical protein SSBG_03233 [Streptomyces sp. SPB074]